MDPLIAERLRRGKRPGRSFVVPGLLAVTAIAALVGAGWWLLVREPAAVVPAPPERAPLARRAEASPETTSSNEPVPEENAPIEEVTGADVARLSPEGIFGSGAAASPATASSSDASGPLHAADGALYEIAGEVRQSLALRDTVLVWLFDASPSAGVRVAEVANRLPSFYATCRETSGNDAAADGGAPDSHQLLSAVGRFASGAEFLVDPPSAEWQKVVPAAEALETAEDPVENTFTAIEAATKRYLNQRVRERRMVMLVVVSDEVGDDQDRIEDALRSLRRASIPLYVIGTPAPFGRTGSDDFGVEGDDPPGRPPRVRTGPESLFLERVDLAYQEVGFSAYRDVAIDSGFGPYSLVRACRETGGRYYTHLVPELTPAFDPKVMRRYTPEYVSEDEYRAKFASNRARQALHEAAGLPRIEVLVNPAVRFSGPDAATLKRRLDEGQQPAARLTPILDQLVETLEDGEADRDRLVEPRWQAGYDLAMGRALAAKARTDGYLATLAALKSRNFSDPSHDTWEVEPADEITVSSSLARMADEARRYLARVVDEHPGTPWANEATEELAIPLGWRIGER